MWIYLRCPANPSGVLRPKSVLRPSCNKQKLHPCANIQMYNYKSLRQKQTRNLGKYIDKHTIIMMATWLMPQYRLVASCRPCKAPDTSTTARRPSMTAADSRSKTRRCRHDACDLITRGRVANLGFVVPPWETFCQSDFDSAAMILLWKIFRGQSSLLHTLCRILLVSVERIRH